MAKRKRRNFTPDFKAKVVLEALSGESSQAEVCRRHNLSEDQLSKLKMRRSSLNPRISTPVRRPSALRTLSNLLDG